MFFTVKEGYGGNIVIPENFIRNDMKLLNNEELRCCLYVFMLCQENADTDIDIISSKLNLSAENVVDAINTLEGMGIIKVSKNKIILMPPVKKENTNICTNHFLPQDLNSIDDDVFKSITQSAQQAYGKMVDEAMLNSLVNIYNWTGLPASVLNLLMFHLVSKGKKSMGILEKAALEWKENEIDTVDKANEYIRKKEESDNNCERIRMLLGIYGRNLVKREKEYVLKWIENYSDSEILEAYELAVEKTGKISFKYTDKILNGEEKTTETKRVKKTGFNNFQQENTTYDDIRKKSLERLLGKNYEGGNEK